MTYRKREHFSKENKFWVPVSTAFIADFLFVITSGLKILTHSSWRDFRMAGMLVADGAFGRIGWDTKKEKKIACVQEK